MKETSETVNKKAVRRAMLVVLAVVATVTALSAFMSFQAIKAEAYARYIGIKDVSAQNIARMIWGVEMNAKNVFEEVAQHLDSPDDVIAALKSKVSYNPETKGYFAAFEPNYFPEKGTWFEPYIYQPDARGFEYRQVGSARHNYMKSPWYVRAKTTQGAFWSDPYYYYDGTSMSGHYCTFVKPIYDGRGKLICVCGADMSFEWMARELDWVDETSRKSNLLNKYHPNTDFTYYTVLFDKDGTCVAHPRDKAVTITDQDMMKDLANRKSGVVDMDVDGVACTLYYGPIDFVDWSLAIVVPKRDVLMPMVTGVAVLFTVGIVGLLIVWLALRSVRVKVVKDEKEA